MMMQIPLVTATAHLAPDRDRVTEVVAGPHTITVDHPSDAAAVPAGPAPLDLMTGALAACSAMSARSFLERDGDPGAVTVTVTLDAGPPTWLQRTVRLDRTLDHREAGRLTESLERTEVTTMMRPAFSIRTVIEGPEGT